MKNIKNIFYTILIGFASLTFSQSSAFKELDQEYLDSLPEEIRNDVQNEINSNEKNEKITRRPSTKLTRLDTVKEFEKFKLQNEIDLV